MGILLVDENDVPIFEHEGIKTPLEKGKEDLPEFAHKIEQVKETTQSIKKDNKKANTAIIAMVVAVVCIIGFMLFQNLQDSKNNES